jgi:hypothetical protein
MLPRIMLLLSFAAAGVPGNVGPDSSPLQPRILVSSSQHPVQVPVFVSFENHCDGDGNLYFHLDKGDYSRTEILFLSADGQYGRTFKLSDKFSDSAKFGFANFSVTPSGDPYLLAWGGQFYLFGFDSNGSMRNPVTLQVPEHVDNDKLLVFESGVSLFYGFYNDAAPNKLKGSSYVALFDSSGRLRKELNGSVSDRLPDAGQPGDLHDGAVAVGDDGNAYVLTSRAITTISEAGELVRRVVFKKPDPRTLALNIYVSGGSVVIGLGKVEDGRLTRKDFLLVEPSTGKPFGLYEPAPEIGFDDVCFSRQEGFTFLRTEKAQRTLVRVPLR